MNLFHDRPRAAAYMVVEGSGAGVPVRLFTAWMPTNSEPMQADTLHSLLASEKMRVFIADGWHDPRRMSAMQMGTPVPRRLQA